MQNIRILNKNFRIVFQEKKAEGEPRARYFVGAGRLHLYIGDSNASTAFDKAKRSKADKIEVKFRAHGKVIFYTK